MTTKFKPKGTWREKLEKKQDIRIVDIPEQMAKRLGHGTMLIPTPLIID